jgi:hypothetical protein
MCEGQSVAAAAAVGELPGVAVTCAVLLSSVLKRRPSCLAASNYIYNMDGYCS